MIEKPPTPEEQFASLTMGFDNLLKGVMLMPVSDELKGRVLSFIGETMENLTRLIKLMIRDEMDEVAQGLGEEEIV